jgi:hypothetical protein
MKNYQKPQATIITVVNSNTIASTGLAGWMEQADVGLETQNITTYVMNS